MKASHTPMWRSAYLLLTLLWVGFCTPCQALTLGDLAVSSRASPNFNASLPFSDQNVIRLPELQTRMATDAEYAQWGLQMPNAVRELRIRVVPISKNMGYIELYSLTQLSQSDFDLLVWASYAGQTILTHFKVDLLDSPSLISGILLSGSNTASQGLRSVASTSSQATPLTKKPQRTVPATADLQSSNSQAPSGLPGQVTEKKSATPDSPLQPNWIQNVSESGTRRQIPEQYSADGIYWTSGLAIVFSCLLFLFGFLAGRLRNNLAKVAPSKTPSARRRNKSEVNFFTQKNNNSKHADVTPRATLSPAKNTPSSTGMITPLQSSTVKPIQIVVPATYATHTVTPTSAITPFVTTHDPVRVQTPSDISPVSTETMPAPQPSGAQVAMPTKEPAAITEDADTLHFEAPVMIEPPANPVATVTVLPRTPATALPTPRLPSSQGRTKAPKKIKPKSAGDSNIDLAKIYLSMGDPATAHTVLQQVMTHGSDAEKALAKQMMEDIA